MPEKENPLFSEEYLVDPNLSEKQKHSLTIDEFHKPEVELSINSTDKEIAIANTQALAVAAKALNQISNFIAGGGLSNLLQGYARSQSVTSILGGLAAHDGRNSLDARVLDQNALEMPYAIEKIFKQFAKHLSSQEREVIKPAEEDPGNRYFMEVDGKQVEVDKKGNPIA